MSKIDTPSVLKLVRGTYCSEEGIVRELGEKAFIATRLCGSLYGFLFRKDQITRRRCRLGLSWSIWVHTNKLTHFLSHYCCRAVSYLYRNLSRPDIVFSGLAYICQDFDDIKPYRQQ